VPVAQDVCRCNGRIFDRNHEADIDITHHSDEVYRLYARKSGSYYVNKVFTAFNIADLRSDLIERARSMTRVRAKDHPWMDMTNEEVVRSAGLVLRDQSSGKEGITLAAILLFGTDQLIMSVLPQHKTDAIFRVFNTDRYDDRDVVLTNLLESYDRLMAFGKKHLNDTFHLDGIQSVSARDNILREIVSNLLAHRDFSNAYVAKLIIEKNCIYTENANLSHGHGVLNLATFEPFSKNPPISKVFREIGLADELGSGMRNTYKYTKMYSGGEPQFIEGDVFRITIPLSEAASVTVGPELSDVINGTRNETRNETKNGTRKLSKTEENILAEIRKNPYVTKREICELLGVGKSTVARATKKLKDHGIIVRVGSTKAGYWKY